MIELREPLDTLANGPQQFTGGKCFPDKIHIYDETLRDGEQMPGVAFTPEQKVELGSLLSDMGVDVMMAAFPISSPSDRLAYKTLLQARKEGRIRQEVELVCIARATRKDIDIIADLTRECGVALDEVGVLVLSTSSDLHMKYKLGQALLRYKGEAQDSWLDRPVQWYRQANIELITDHIAHAKRLGFGTIEFAAEDASRGDRDYFRVWAKECQRAGGTRVCFSDTNGVFTPEAVDYYFAGIRQTLPNLDITAHFHNDFGLAAINTVRALSHGATHASITACGLGERAGNGSIHQVLMVLKQLYGVTVDGFAYERLWELRDAVERCAGVPIQAHEPIIGHNVFSHESGMHTAAVSIHPAIYQCLDERAVGGEHRFVYGKHSGRVSVERIMDKHAAALDLDAKERSNGLSEKVLAAIKERREATATEVDHRYFIEQYYDHLRGLGLSEEAVVEILKETLRKDRARRYFMT